MTHQGTQPRWNLLNRQVTLENPFDRLNQNIGDLLDRSLRGTE